MEETLKHEVATQCIGLPPAGPGNHRLNESKANHAITFKLDHLMRAHQRHDEPHNHIADTHVAPPLTVADRFGETNPKLRIVAI